VLSEEGAFSVRSKLFLDRFIESSDVPL